MSEDKTTNHDKELVEETELRSLNVLQGGLKVCALSEEEEKSVTSGYVKEKMNDPNAFANERHSVVDRTSHRKVIPLTTMDIAHIPLDHVVATDGKTIFGIKPKDIPEASDFSKDPRLSSLRVQALKIATEMALKINHFEPNYSTHKDPLEALLKDVDIVHKIADRNLKYIMGEKE